MNCLYATIVAIKLDVACFDGEKIAKSSVGFPLQRFSVGEVDCKWVVFRRLDMEK